MSHKQAKRERHLNPEYTEIKKAKKKFELETFRKEREYEKQIADEEKAARDLSKSESSVHGDINIADGAIDKAVETLHRTVRTKNRLEQA